MSDVIVDEHGGAKIPKDVLEKLEALPGDLLRFNVLSDGTVILRAKNRSISELAGILYREGQAALPVEKMSP
jgi:antitoxin PrlF